MFGTYIAPVKWTQQFLSGLLGCIAVAILSGCAGIDARPSVSPATFLLPGLGQTASPSETTKSSFTSADSLGPVSPGIIAAH